VPTVIWYRAAVLMRLAFVALVLTGTTALAQECPIPDGANPKLARVDDAARLDYLRDALMHDSRNATVWRWGWVTGFALATAAELGLSQAVEPNGRVDFYVGAGATALAMVPLLALPLKVEYDGPAFALKPVEAGNTCALIKEGEQLAVMDSVNEAAGTGWLMQVINVIYNAVTASILGFGYHHWTSAIATGVGGLVAGEAMILTQPTHLSEAWRTYQTGQLKPEIPGVTLRFGFMPGGGIALNGTF